jgi:hypothetical protein
LTNFARVWGKKVVKSSTSSVFFPGEKSPDFPKFFGLETCRLGFKRKKKRKISPKGDDDKLLHKIGKKNPLLTTLCFIYCRDKYYVGARGGGGGGGEGEKREAKPSQHHHHMTLRNEEFPRCSSQFAVYTYGT